MADYATACVLSYNRPKFLNECLTSMLNAGAPYELIVHDDGSDEMDVDLVLEDWADRATIITNPPCHNQGVGEAIRRMFVVASGDPLVKIDQDLIFRAGWLRRVADLLSPIEGRILPLTDKAGRITGCTIVDADDYDWAGEYRWRLHPKGYAATHALGKTKLLHRVMLAAGEGAVVDHRNRRRLDNRRSNLLLTTPAGNMENRSANRNGTSTHRGVSWNTKEQKWYAFAKKDGKSKYLGSFDDEDLAAAAARAWRVDHMPLSVEEPAAPDIGLLGLFHYHHEPVDTSKTLVAQHAGWQEHTHICGSAFAVPRAVYDALGIGTHSAAFAEDWELMKLITDASPFVCALPDEDLVTNQGFGIGPSTVVITADTVQPIHTGPVLLCT